ncbi:MAG TPA: hypothetical protein VIL46_04600, partial [Gemmataceae bacterium]
VQSPDKIAKELKQGADTIRSRMSSEGEKPPPLPKWVEEKVSFEEIPVEQHLVIAPWFDPFAQPETKRVNPTVLAPVEFQADLVRAKIHAIAMQVDDTLRIGMRVPRKEEQQRSKVQALTTLVKQLGKRNDTLKKRIADAIRREKRNRAAGAPGGFPGGGPGGSPGGRPGGFGLPAGPGEAPGAVAGGEEGAMPGMPGMPGGGYNPNVIRSDVNIKYYDLEELQKNPPAGAVPAETILPKRMIVVNASFPYKQQFEEFKRALRLRHIGEVPPPFFKGIEVERKVMTLDGSKEIQPWSALDFEADYRETIYPRKVGDAPEDPELAWVMLHPAYRLVLPLPLLAHGEYPKVTLGTIRQTIDKFKEMNKPPTFEDPNIQKLKGEGDIYAPVGAVPGLGYGSPGGYIGEPSEDGAPGAAFPADGIAPGGVPGPLRGSPPDPRFGRGRFAPTPMGGGVMPPGSRQPMMGQPGVGGQLYNQANFDPQEYVLIRFADTDVRPGFSYLYRVRVVVENPNYQQTDLVAKPSDAKKETLTSDWAEMKPEQRVQVPMESHLYAITPPEDLRQPLREGEAMVQMQTWLEQVKPESSAHQEPVGDWIVTDLRVREGEHVGGRALVKLPLWSMENNAYVLRELRLTRVRKGEKPPKGVILDLSRPDLLVVDVEGGRVREKLGANRRTFEDDTATEILLMEGDGSLRVLNTLRDAEDPKRKEREEAWENWVKQVEDSSQRFQSTDPGGMFDRGSPDS